MRQSFRILKSDSYHLTEPALPKKFDIWADEGDGYLKVYTYINNHWVLVVDIVPCDGDEVQITFDTEDESDEIDLLDYRYRIGAL